jgi:hypothetical protein
LTFKIAIQACEKTFCTFKNPFQASSWPICIFKIAFSRCESRFWTVIGVFTQRSQAERLLFPPDPEFATRSRLRQSTRARPIAAIGGSLRPCCGPGERRDALRLGVPLSGFGHGRVRPKRGSHPLGGRSDGQASGRCVFRRARECAGRRRLRGWTSGCVTWTV